MWPDNQRALAVFQRVGTRWMLPPAGVVPYGLRWEAIYPLMDRLGLDAAEWDQLHSDLMVMEHAALDTMREFAPKPKP